MDYNQWIELTTEYGMPLLKALLLLVGGWLLAKIISSLSKKALDKTDWDNKLASYLTGGRSKDLPIEAGIANFVFWLIMLFVLMAVFQTLNLTIVTEPINVLVTKITSYFPQILGAAAIGLGAWAIATVLRIVVSNLLGAFKIDDKLGESAGEETKQLSLASTLGDAVYYLVFLLFLPQILDALQMDGLSPVKDMVGRILGFLPNLLGAAVIFLIFYLVSRIVQRLVTNLLTSFGFDSLPSWLGLGTPKEGSASASTIAGFVVLTVLLFLGSIQAFETLELEIVSNLTEELLAGLFNVLIACVIFGFGLFFSRLAHQGISASGQGQAAVLANVARGAILIFTGAMALFRAGLAPDIVTLAFGALIVGLALAGGLAFGLGGREEAARVISSWRQDS